MPAGYSGKPLWQKLGIKGGTVVHAVDAPGNYRKTLGGLPPGASIADNPGTGAQFVHLFVTEQRALAKHLKDFRKSMDPDGVLWVSWPKRASGVATDITEDAIRRHCLPLGWVDIKVCAVDETWSALKLMVRREERQ